MAGFQQHELITQMDAIALAYQNNPGGQRQEKIMIIRTGGLSMSASILEFSNHLCCFKLLSNNTKSPFDVTCGGSYTDQLICDEVKLKLEEEGYTLQVEGADEAEKIKLEKVLLHKVRMAKDQLNQFPFTQLKMNFPGQ